LRPAQTLFDEFATRLRNLDRTRLKVEALSAKRQITRWELERVYESLLINAVTSFEGFLEDLFVGLMLDGQGVSLPKARCAPRIVIKSYQLARDLILGNRRYVDWLPYDQTLNRANTFFVGGRPFSTLPKTSQQQLEKVIAARHAVAHQSSHAQRRFEREVVGTSTVLLPRERKVAGYLRSVYVGTTNRYDELTGYLGAAARNLAS
jgi:hypothetical protein